MITSSDPTLHCTHLFLPIHTSPDPFNSIWVQGSNIIGWKLKSFYSKRLSINFVLIQNNFFQF